ncbi:hypothetical protein [Metabacillus schmidteae]|uniref:hypothetical protein n=1 Tax=Metabacillus schmidteae TaxID=2730405 RepID=UPI001C379826|nr:hypothetical protein [Metabacillus schmidteae]
MEANEYQDFYCDEVLSGRTPVKIVLETENVLAFFKTRITTTEGIIKVIRQQIDEREDSHRFFRSSFDIE